MNDRESHDASADHGQSSRRDEQAEHAGPAHHAGHADDDKHAGHADDDKHAGHTDRAERAGHAGHAGHDGHDEHAGHSVAMFRSKFWLSLILTVPVVFWSGHIQELVGYQAPVFPGSRWIPPVFGTVVFLYGGLVFLQGAWRELKQRQPGMMTLISLAITVAFLFSVAVELGFRATALWWELATLVTVMLLGHWI
ncbi:MAG: heavy metal translocating P-type ATPase, partial [Candidatus Krumholzibacteriia bacterium]